MLLIYSQFVWVKGTALLAISLLAVACGRQAVTFPPPPQRSLDLGPDPALIGAYIKMDDPAAADYIIRDIAAEAGFQRWAFRSPELKFHVKDGVGLTFVMNFAIPEVTFQKTGPVTVWAEIDGQNLGKMRCDHAGDFRYERPAPTIDPQRDVHVILGAEPRWVSPEDGAQLSFLLRGAGFNP
jgi:hypothetical protein